MAKKIRAISERQQLVRAGVVAGMTKREASSHADTILRSRDRVIVDTDGTETPAPNGPEL